jgi:GAF domain-containing protein
VNGGRLHAAVAASSLAGEEAHHELLQSIVETARSIFGAKASSIILYDEEPDELVFRAATGEGSERLIGTRFGAGEGIAGFVLRSGEPLVVEDVTKDPRFARRVAERSGYVPQGLMAVPLLRGDRTLGVLQVLDRPADARFTLAEMDLLALFGRQAAIALDIVESAAAARSVLADDPEAAAVARVAEALEALEGPRREAGRRLMRALEELLSGSGGPRRGDDLLL